MFFSHLQDDVMDRGRELFHGGHVQCGRVDGLAVLYYDVSGPYLGQVVFKDVSRSRDGHGNYFTA